MFTAYKKFTNKIGIYIQLQVNVLTTMVVALFGTVFGHLFPLRNERGLLRDIKSSGWGGGLK